MSSVSEETKNIFEDFLEYWHFVKYLNTSQRDILVKSLPVEEKNRIEKSYRFGGWEDLFMRDTIDSIIDNIKKRFGYNIVELRCKVLSGKSVYIPKQMWDYIVEKTESFDIKHTNYMLYGVKGVEAKGNKNVVVLLRCDDEE